MKQGRNFRSIILELVLLLSLLMATQAVSSEIKQKIFLVGSIETKQSFHGRWLELIYTEVFKRLGYSLKYEGYPAKRASRISDMGDADGEIHRVYDYGNKHSNVIRVEESHFSIYFSAYGVDPKIQLNGWESLRETNYNVGYRHGVKKTESKLPELVPKNQLRMAIKIEQGLRQVLAGRSEIFIDVQHVIEDSLKTDNKFKHSNLHRLGIMEETTAHAFLYKTHKSLAPKVSSVLKQMKKEGVIDKYRTMAE